MVNAPFTSIRDSRFGSQSALQRERPMDAVESSPLITFDTVAELIKKDPALTAGKPSNDPEAAHDIFAAGAASIDEIEKLMEELRVARDYLKAEGERVRRLN